MTYIFIIRCFKKIIIKIGENMKNVGLIRKVDELGRIVLPIEMRRVLDIKEKDQLEILNSGDAIIIRKYKPYCIFCGSEDIKLNYKDNNICKNCYNELKNSEEYL